LSELEILIQDDDARGFIAEVEQCIKGILRAYTPSKLILIKIDNWFGSRWLRFSGKALGALGVWRGALTAPPFVPKRVISEFWFSAPDYLTGAPEQPIHVWTESRHALRRDLSKIAPDASLLWYSGNSQKTRRGTVMAYIWHSESYWAWYAEWADSDGWRVVATKNIGPADIAKLKDLQTQLPKGNKWAGYL